MPYGVWLRAGVSLVRHGWKAGSKVRGAAEWRDTATYMVEPAQAVVIHPVEEPVNAGTVESHPSRGNDSLLECAHDGEKKMGAENVERQSNSESQVDQRGSLLSIYGDDRLGQQRLEKEITMATEKVRDLLCSNKDEGSLFEVLIAKGSVIGLGPTHLTSAAAVLSIGLHEMKLKSHFRA